MAELRIEQDALRDTVTINGIVYARAVFEDFGATMPLGRVFRLVSRENNVLTIEYLPAGASIPGMGVCGVDGWCMRADCQRCHPKASPATEVKE